MQFSTHARVVALTAALLAATVALPASNAAATPAPRGAYRVEKPGCATARTRRGTVCEALRLVPLEPAGARVGSPGRARAATPLKARGYEFGLTPQQLHAAYELPAETPLSGAQTIALVDPFKDSTVESDLALYDKQFGLPECTKVNGCLRVINEEGAESPLPANNGGWAVEITIDVQMAHAICQSCHILLVEADYSSAEDLGAGVKAAVAAGATEISNSYGSALETEYPDEERALAADYYDHPGTVITAAAGDCGYRDQNDPGSFEENCPPGEPSDVEFPAASPDVLAVGGTTLTEGEDGWQSTVWGETGGGCASAFSAQAWQTAVSNWSRTGCGSERLSADVAAEGDPDTGVAVVDDKKWGVYGGTSVASPIIAAEFALAGGARGVSYPAQTLYRHLGQASALYDVSSGANGACGTLACEAAVGYDGPSGVGSPLGLAAFAPSSATPANTTAPSIAGTAEVGETLEVTPGVWTNSPSSVIYQWQTCDSAGGKCLPIQGATAQSYKLVPDDAGFTIRVMETASNAEGFGPPALSRATTEIPAAAPAPTITGLSPKSGYADTKVTISGTSFVDVESVSFGTQAARNVDVISEDEITAEAPEGSGTVLVTVTTSSGASTEKHKGKAEFKYKKPKK